MNENPEDIQKEEEISKIILKSINERIVCLECKQDIDQDDVDEIQRLKKLENYYYENYNTKKTLGFSGDCSTLENSRQREIFYYGETNISTFKRINAYVPDMFRRCWYDTILDTQKISPIYIFFANVYYYNQKLIDENIIKGYLYFGFKSIATDSISNGKATYDQYPLLTRYYKSFPEKLFVQNSGQFTNFPVYFYSKYQPNTIFFQLINFLLVLTESSDIYAVSKASCLYYFPWWAIVYGIFNDTTFLPDYFNAWQVGLNNNLLYNLNKLYVEWLGATNKTQFETDNNLNVDILFKVLTYTREVFTDVATEYFYEYSHKQYCKKEYMKPVYKNICDELYQIYVNNWECCYIKKFVC